MSPPLARRSAKSSTNTGALPTSGDTAPTNAADFLRKMGAKFLVSGHIASESGYSIPNEQQVIVDCAESPAGFILFPADRPITHQQLVECIRVF